jgi:hypothetical protein
MSHVTDVKLTIKDLDAVEEACEALGLELVREKKTFEWYGRWVNDFRGATAAVDQGFDPATFGQCEHAIRIKGAAKGSYEIGLVKDPSGDGYRLLYDAWGNGQNLERAAGKGLNRLRHEYAVAQARKNATATLARRGWTMAPREDLGAGRTRLKLRRR